MELLATYKYKMKNATKKNLLTLGFCYYAPSKSGTNDLYKYIFPIYNYKRNATTVCELIVEENTGDTVMSVYYKNIKKICPPFYGANRNMYDKKYISIMTNNIRKEFRKLNIREVVKNDNV